MRVQLLQDLQDFFRKKSEIETDKEITFQLQEDLMKLLTELYTSKEITFQLQEDLMKLLTELYTVMKTYHMYHAETISAEAKLREVERQEGRVKGVSGSTGGAEPVFGLRIEERHQRRNAARKMEKMREKRKAKYSENKLKTLKARNEYLLTLEATNASVFKYYIHDLPDIIDCCDLGYHSSLSRALRTYLSAELSLEASRRAGLEVLEGAVEGLDPARDRQRLLGLYPTAFCPPARFSFQAHMGDVVNQIAAQPQVKKTWGATLTALQDMTVPDDSDVSQSFTHSPSSESVRSSASDGYLSKPSLAKRRANQQETELFYFTPRTQELPQQTPGLQHQGIFRVSGSQVEVNDIKNSFERGMENLYERAQCIRKIMLGVPRATLVVMRYLFAFLNHTVTRT
ncbi:hypothetical protein CRUP_017319 [Coryphaenoides rupestris]|nr:hypothetical protein CRUP_017319 [Coryphaenoides rupestris]